MSECTAHDLPETDREKLCEALTRVMRLRDKERTHYVQAKAALRRGRRDIATKHLAEATSLADEANGLEQDAHEQWGSK